MKQTGPERVMGLESLSRLSDVANHPLASFRDGQLRDLVGFVSFGAEHRRAKAHRLWMVRQGRIEQRKGQLRIRELIGRDSNERRDPAATIVVAASLDGQLL